jgi:hypothetical protein
MKAIIIVSLLLTVAVCQDWTLLSKGPYSGREGVMGVSFGDYIYLSGGRTTMGLGFSNEVWRSKNGTEWEKVTASAPWEKRAYHIMLVLNNCMVLMGG